MSSVTHTVHKLWRPQIENGSQCGAYWTIYSGTQRDSPHLIMIVCTCFFDMRDVCLYINPTEGDRSWVESSDLPIKGWIGVYSCCVYAGSETGWDYRARAVVYSIFFHLRLKPSVTASFSFSQRTISCLASTPLLLSQQLSFNLSVFRQCLVFSLSFVRIW